MATEPWRERNVTAMNILRGRSFLVKLDPTRCGLITSQPGRIVAWAASQCWPNDLNESHQSLFCSKILARENRSRPSSLGHLFGDTQGPPILGLCPNLLPFTAGFLRGSSPAGVHPREFFRGSPPAGVQPLESNRWSSPAGVHPLEPSVFIHVEPLISRGQD